MFSSLTDLALAPRACVSLQQSHSVVVVGGWGGGGVGGERRSLRSASLAAVWLSVSLVSSFSFFLLISEAGPVIG